MRVSRLSPQLILPAILSLSALAAPGQPAVPPALTPQDAQALVQRALATEMRAAQATGHPMRYRLRKSSPRLTSTKQIVETKDGDVARLLSIDDRPLSPGDELKEQSRLDALLADPSRQRHRKLGEDQDTARALKVLRALPDAFLYQYAGVGPSQDPAFGIVQKFTLQPNPSFNPPSLETMVLTAMNGEIWIDPAHERVTRLETHLFKDVDFGWGILGRLDKGGWVRIDQADVGEGQWRIVRFEMKMSGRVLFKNKNFDTLEEQTSFAPVPTALDYRQAIQMLRQTPPAPSQPGH